MISPHHHYRDVTKSYCYLYTAMTMISLITVTSWKKNDDDYDSSSDFVVATQLERKGNESTSWSCYGCRYSSTKSGCYWKKMGRESVSTC